MPENSILRPTLWRTCRVLANFTRLKIFAALLHEPNQTVSAVAAQLHQPLSLVSEYLRALEARGLLTVRREGPRVKYRISPSGNGSGSSGLVSALRSICQTEPEPPKVIFNLVTGFTHPRRIEIFRVLQPGPRNLGQLRMATRISTWALLRHLRKLSARGFVTHKQGMYVAVQHTHALGRELARLAGQE